MDSETSRAGIEGRILELGDRLVEVSAPAHFSNARVEAWIDWADGQMILEAGDTLTVPKGLVRSFRSVGTTTVELYVVRGGDHPAAPRFA